MKKILLILSGLVFAGNVLAQGCPNAQNAGMNIQLFQYNLATATPNATPTYVSTPIAALAPPQALAAITMLPTPVSLTFWVDNVVLTAKSGYTAPNTFKPKNNFYNWKWSW